MLNPRGVYINDDFSAFWCAGPDKMNEAGLREQIDYYAGISGGVQAIIFNMNASRAYYDSKVFTPIWKDVEFREDGSVWFHGREVVDTSPEPPMKTMCRNAWLLHKNFGNPMAFRYQYCHEKGIEMWHGMRMNDCHWTPDPELPQHSDLWYNHVEWQVAGYLRKYSYAWEHFPLDFTNKEVRDYTLAMLKEYLSFECDGIELDWMRALPVFRQGFAERGRPLLTEFMREARRAADSAAKRWGHPVRIMLRCPADPQIALFYGMDVQKWAQEGLFDILQPYVAYANLPIELWKQLMPDTIEIAGGVTHNVSSGSGGQMLACVETDNGLAANLYHAGADSMYIFNHFWRGCCTSDREKQRIVYSTLGDCGKVYSQMRRHVFTKDFIAGSLPPLAWAKSSVSFTINAGGRTAARNARILIAGSTPITADVLVNAVKCEYLPDAPLPSPLPSVPKDSGRHFAVYQIPAGVLTDGINGIDVINMTAKDFNLYWAEIDIDPE